MIFDKFCVRFKLVSCKFRHCSTLVKELTVDEFKASKKYNQPCRRRKMPNYWNSDNLYVSTTKDKKLLILNFLYDFPNDKESKNQLTTSFRSLDSNLISTYERLTIKLNERILPRPKKEKKKNNKNPAAIVPSSAKDQADNLLTLNSFAIKSQSGEILDPNSIQNSTAFLELGNTFHINDRVYRIVSSVPYLDKFKIDQRLFVGFPIVPSVTVIDGCPNLSSFYWFVEDSPSKVKTNKNLKEKPIVQSSTIPLDDAENSNLVIDGFTLKSTAFSYVPSAEDVGRRISLICIPRNEKTPGSPVTYTSHAVVEDLQEDWIWTERHEMCAQRAPKDALRIVDYNVLANLYLDLDPKIKQDDLFYFYCPVEYQQYNYRYPLLLREILGYNADLLCLQEVETKFWMRFLEPFLSRHGYAGTFAKKGCEVAEGSATFYRRDKLELIESSGVLISNLIKENNAHGFEDIAEVCNQNEKTKKLWLSRPSVLQVGLFRCLAAQSTLTVVCSTHFHYKPHHGHIRLLQAAVCLRYLSNYVESLKLRYKEEKIGIIFCGDFNSTLEGSVHKMMTTGRLSADDQDWSAGSTTETTFKGLDFQVNFALHSAFSPVEYSNYVFANKAKVDTSDKRAAAKKNKEDFDDDSELDSENLEANLTAIENSKEFTDGPKCFQGVLDYIFISDGIFDVRRSFPMPRDDLVKKFQALPSKICPSDHLPLICDLNLK